MWKLAFDFFLHLSKMEDKENYYGGLLTTK